MIKRFLEFLLPSQLFVGNQEFHFTPITTRFLWGKDWLKADALFSQLLFFGGNTKDVNTNTALTDEMF